MNAEITINGSAAPAVRYLGWAPVPAQIRIVDPGAATGPINVLLRNRATGTRGRMVFYGALPGPARPDLALALPVSGTPVSFHLGGEFQRPSRQDGDAMLEAVDTGTGAVLGTVPLMVRVRKDATTLTTAERDRFIAAFARLNNRGMGRFADFRNVHTDAGDPEAHQNAGFLPWHRAYLLDLERELQAIDPSVALPYWRFDRPARAVFALDFMGVAETATGAVRFSAANPLQFWATDGVVGIVRRPQFTTASQPAMSPQGGQVRDEPQTFGLGGTGRLYHRFRRMEGNPHGTAHVAFTGSISDIPTAAKDPLFFMLHANVDRLWAKWQWATDRFEPTDPAAFSPPDSTNLNPGLPRVGHRLTDSMWPWNGVTTPPRPRTAPGGTMAPSLLTNAPGLRPTVRSMIDYQGVRNLSNRLGFDYDDVPFEFS